MVFIMLISQTIVAQWTQINSGTNLNLSQITFSSSGKGYISGDSGTVLINDNGVNWNKQIVGDTAHLYTINAPTNNLVITAGNSDGNFLKWNRSINGGNSWQALEAITVSNPRVVNDLFFINDSVGFGACHQPSITNQTCLIKTINGGNSWSYVDPSITTGGYRKSNAVFFVNDSVGYLVGDSRRVLKSTDTGNTWQEVLPPSTIVPGNVKFKDVFFLTADFGFVVGGVNGIGYVVSTTDGGTNWSADTFPEIVNSVYFKNNLFGYMACDSGKIYYTLDAGDSWFSNTTNVMNRLNSIYFYNNIGYVVGDSGIILQLGTSQSFVDASFILSTDSVICEGTQVEFINTSTDSVNYEWSLDGMVITTTKDFEYTFTDFGSYQIKLKAYDNMGSADSVMKDISVVKRANALAFAENDSVALGGTLSFSSFSSNAVSLNWYLNNSLIGSTSDIDITFSELGIQDVFLVASNDGCKDTSITLTVTVVDTNGSDTALFLKPINDNNRVYIYPNPVKDVLNITTTDNQTSFYVYIYNIIGEVVYESYVFDNESINIEDIRSGNYFLVMKTENKEYYNSYISVIR